MKKQLKETLPKICAYFEQPDFMNILAELEKYHNNVEKHNREFLETQRIWAKIMEHFAYQQLADKRVSSLRVISGIQA
jgi:hypothetical protein